MAERDPRSPPKNEPDPKRPSTRSVSVAQESATIRNFGLKPLAAFCGTQLPTNGEVLQRFFNVSFFLHFQRYLKKH